MTLARDAGDEASLRDALARLAAVGLPVIVADGGSSEPFVDFLRAQRSFTVLTGARGLVAQVQASIGAAWSSGASRILYTEPDKATFFERQLDGFVDAALAAGDAGIVLASRSARAYATFPAIQQYTEGVVNALIARAAGIDGDYCYGPFVVNRTVADYVNGVDARAGWGWRPHLFVVAHRLGHALRHVVGDFECPAGQRRLDETVHRIRQLAQNAEGIASGLTVRL